jgi:hypothetical protein
LDPEEEITHLTPERVKFYKNLSHTGVFLSIISATLALLALDSCSPGGFIDTQLDGDFATPFQAFLKYCGLSFVTLLIAMLMIAQAEHKLKPKTKEEKKPSGDNRVNTILLPLLLVLLLVLLFGVGLSDLSGGL